MNDNLSIGDEWPEHYRGYQLHTNADGEVWWQVYRGTDRLYLDPTPNGLIEQLHSLKRLGGRIRVTEGNDVLTQIEDGDSYETVWVGELALEGQLVPTDDPEYSIDLRPTGLSPGDLWPSVYDGSKYSFGHGAERIWWQNPTTNKRHPVTTSLPDDVLDQLRRFKSDGGSFLVTPWGEVITLVRTNPAPNRIRKQLRNLPLVVQNIIKLRKERGLEMLPIYIGQLDQTPIEVDEPVSLTDSLSTEEQHELESWASSLGSTSSTTSSNHQAEQQETVSDDPNEW